jgi:hypothetical protein
LARSYESNGPDVKVRGTAQHIADRYLQLARDAHSSGDPVLAESYYQYAEHYLRIIAAAQEQMQGQYGYRPRSEGGTDEEGEGDEGEAESDGPQAYTGQPLGGFNGQQHQVHRGANGTPANGTPAVAGDEQPPMFSPPPRERFDNRNQRFGERDRDRDWNRNRNDGNRNDGNRSDGNRSDGNRSDGNRNDGSRYEGNRNDQGRRDNYRRDQQRDPSEGSAPSEAAGESRQHQPRGGHAEGGNDQHGSEPRRFQGRGEGEGRPDRPHRERFERGPRQPAPEEQTLPSFITAPVRAAPPVTEAAPEEAETRETKADAAFVEELATPAAESVAAAPRPRRGRPRRVAEPAPAPDENTAPAADSSPIGAK